MVAIDSDGTVPTVYPILHNSTHAMYWYVCVYIREYDVSILPTRKEATTIA